MKYEHILRQRISILLIIAFVGIVSACAARRSVADTVQTNNTSPSTQATIVTVGADRFHELITTSTDAVLLDVRTLEEYQQAHIPGATLIPVQELEARLAELAAYADRDVLVYCRSGNRSMTAAKILEQAGFTSIYNLGGGIHSNGSAGYPIQ